MIVATQGSDDHSKEAQKNEGNPIDFDGKPPAANTAITVASPITEQIASVSERIVTPEPKLEEALLNRSSSRYGHPLQ